MNDHTNEAAKPMSRPRKLYEFLMAASRAHARWDMEVSMNIIKNKKMILLLLLLPILGVALVEAAPMLGGKTAYAPAFYTTNIFLVSIAIGLFAGLITGAIGAGGGFIIAPALMAAGVKGILAVGTDVFHIFAKAIMGTTVHAKLGNVSVKLAMAFLVGSAAGTFIGGAINLGLYNKDPLLSEAFISTVYAILLGFLSLYSLIDFLKARAAGLSCADHSHQAAQIATTNFALRLQQVNIPPMISFDHYFVEGGRKISWLFLAMGGLVVGILAAIMGVGGGFITFPMFVYIFGVSTATTVGTDILQIIFTAGLASIFQYAIYGYVFYTLAIGMLIGSLIGIQVGALTTKVVTGCQIRGFFALSIFAGFVNRASALPKKMVELEYIDISRPVVNAIELGGNIIFWLVVVTFGVWVIGKFISNIGALRGKEQI